MLVSVLYEPTLLGELAPSRTSFLLGHAVVWRVIYTLMLSWVVKKQSKTKFWTRHFQNAGSTGASTTAVVGRVLKWRVVVVIMFLLL